MPESPSGQPSIDLFGITIMEPMVSFTDLWITTVCVYAFIQLKRLNKQGKVHQYMRWYFLIMGMATFLGGILGHAFQHAVGLEWKLPGWLISMIAVMAVERATIMHAQPVINERFGKFFGNSECGRIAYFCRNYFFNIKLFLYPGSFCLWIGVNSSSSSLSCILENPKQGQPNVRVNGSVCYVSSVLLYQQNWHWSLV